MGPSFLGKLDPDVPGLLPPGVGARAPLGCFLSESEKKMQKGLFDTVTVTPALHKLSAAPVTCLSGELGTRNTTTPATNPNLIPAAH